MREIIRAAWVIARRDFTAIIFSKAFFFFLLGPLFPLAIGLAAGGLGSQVARDINRPVVAVAMDDGLSERILAAREELATQIGENRLPQMQAVAADSFTGDAESLLNGKEDGGQEHDFIAVLSGNLASPLLTGPNSALAQWQGEISLIADQARAGSSLARVPVATAVVAESEGARTQARLRTAQVGQAALFLLTMLLAGMVLSNLVEEKTNKIIEILAAAIPIDAIFIGKLFAMLAMAFVGIAVWMTVGAAALQLFGDGLPTLTPPAIGWPAFLLLAFLYFAMAYLLLGSLFLGVGALATTVREVQTLSMPVTMAQLLVFFLAAFAVTKLGEPIELFAAIFPFSSPFAMLARAAQLPDIWPHLVALLWQGVWAYAIVRIGARIFRRNVMKSGKTKGKKRRRRAIS